MKTGVQIKAASFPPSFRWDEDLAELKASGISEIAVTVSWFLCEKYPSGFDFSPFEEQLDSAAARGFKWILIPDVSAPPPWMKDFCIDSEKFRTGLYAFLSALASQYGNEAAFHAWDLSSLSIPECACVSARELFAKYLASCFQSIRNLNEKWHRNYFTFDSVPVATPECFPDSAESMFFRQFQVLREESFFRDAVQLLQEHSRKGSEIFLPPRMTELAAARMKAVSVPLKQDVPETEQTLALASVSDSFGKADLKIWMRPEPGKLDNSAPMLPNRLYRFLWNAAAYGADEVVLGEWDRDSLANPLASDDFYYEERKAKLFRFTQEMERFRTLLAHWTPEQGETAIFRSRISGHFRRIRGIPLRTPLDSLRGWIRSFAETSTPFAICSEDTLNILEKKKLLILPGTPILEKHVIAAILDFVHAGGTLVCEPECGAWSTTGVPLRPDSRFIAEAFGICEMARMPQENTLFQLKYNKKNITLKTSGYVVPLKTVKKYTEVLLPFRNNTALAEQISYGKGTVILLGAVVGAAALAERSGGLEDFVNDLLKKVSPEFNLITKNCRVIPGLSDKTKMLFIFSSGADKIEISFAKSFWKKQALRDLISGKRVNVTANGDLRVIKFVPDASGVAVLCEEAKAE